MADRMRKFLVTLLLTLTACAAPPKQTSSNNPVQFRDMEGVRSYWGRTVELYQRVGVINASDPDLKACLINGAMRLTTPEMGVAIERYLTDKTAASLDAAGAIELGTYRNGIFGSQMLLRDGTCSEPSQESVRYGGVTEVQSFWDRTVELRFSGFGFVYAPDPGIRHCHVDSATRLTTPEMKMAIERFATEKTTGNLDAILAAERKTYPAGVMESEAYLAAIGPCEDKELAKTFKRLSQVQTRHAFLEEFARMGSEQHGEPVEFRTPAIVDCLAKAADAAFSNTYLFAIDRYVADKTRTNWDEIIRTYSSLDSIQQANMDKAGYACKTN